MLMSRLLEEFQQFLPLRGRWLLSAVCVLLAVAVVAGGAVERAVPGLRTWFIERGCAF